MSRFEDTLQRDLAVIADRATPSPQAWQQIHRRIIDQEPIQETEIIMLTENTTRTRRWPLLAAAAALAALAIGAIALVNRDDTTEDPADTPEPTPTIAPTPDQDVGAGASATELPFTKNYAEPGRYTTEQLGVSVTFDLPRELWLEEHQTGQMMLLGVLEGDYTLPNLTPDNLIVLRMERLAGWSTRAEAQLVQNTGSIDPYDIDGWITSNDLIVSVDRRTEIDGRATRVIHARVSPDAESAFDCWEDWKPCSYVRAIANDGIVVRGNWLSEERDERMYIVTIEGSEPLVIIAGGPDGSVWFDEFDDVILPSIEIGPDAPPLDYSAPARIIGDSSVGDATVEEATGLLDDWAEAWNAADREAVSDLFGTDAVLVVPGGREYVGEDAGNYMAQFVGSYPTLRRVSEGVPAENGSYSFDVEWEGSRQTDRRVLIITMADGELLIMDEQLPQNTG